MANFSNPAKFLRTFWLTAIILFLSICSFNALVDPFRLFGAPPITGFNQLKPEIGTHARMAKAYAVRSIQPHGIVLGNSRADVGIDPEHVGWNRQSTPVYNLALSSGRIDEILSYLQHAQAHGPLRQVVLSLDFMMFNANWRHEADFDPDRLSTPEAHFPSVSWWADSLKALFSLDGLSASVRTVKAQHESTTSSHLPNGARDNERKWAHIQAMGGHRRAFLNNTRYDLISPDGWPLFSLEASERGDGTSDSLEEIARFCKHYNIELKVFISPIHANKLEVIWQLGLGPEYEHWKRHVVEVVSRSGFALWDFSGYNSITTEPFPPLGDNTTMMNNYWEGSHYRREVGDLILDRLFATSETGRIVPSDFGIRLSPDNIEDHLRMTRDDHEHYRSQRQPDIEEVAKLVSETADKRRRIP